MGPGSPVAAAPNVGGSPRAVKGWDQPSHTHTTGASSPGWGGCSPPPQAAVRIFTHRLPLLALAHWKALAKVCSFLFYDRRTSFWKSPEASPGGSFTVKFHLN